MRYFGLLPGALPLSKAAELVDSGVDALAGESMGFRLLQLSRRAKLPVWAVKAKTLGELSHEMRAGVRHACGQVLDQYAPFGRWRKEIGVPPLSIASHVPLISKLSRICPNSPAFPSINSMASCMRGCGAHQSGGFLGEEAEAADEHTDGRRSLRRPERRRTTARIALGVK